MAFIISGSGLNSASESRELRAKMIKRGILANVVGFPITVVEIGIQVNSWKDFDSSQACLGVIFLGLSYNFLA